MEDTRYLFVIITLKLEFSRYRDWGIVSFNQFNKIFSLIQFNLFQVGIRALGFGGSYTFLHCRLRCSSSFRLLEVHPTCVSWPLSLFPPFSIVAVPLLDCLKCTQVVFHDHYLCPPLLHCFHCHGSLKLYWWSHVWIHHPLIY